MAFTEGSPMYKATYDLVLVIFRLVKNFNKEYNFAIIKLFFIFIISFGQYSYSQQIEVQITGTIGKAFLSELSGEKIVGIDSVNSSIGVYQFFFDESNHHAGFYRLSFGYNNQSLQSRAQTGWIDFIYDREEVYLRTDANNILDSLKVIKSKYNEIYYEFIKHTKDYKTKSELLQLILARYPKGDSYYQTTKEKLTQVQENYLSFVNITARVNPNSFVARYVKSAQLPVIDIKIPFEEQLTYLKIHALDNVYFYDDELIYSDAFTNKTIEYLTYYRNPQLPLELIEKEFNSAIDTILNKARVNEIVYTHIVEHLLDGFKKFGFDNVINYILESYVIKDDLCLDQKLTNTLERRIQQARNFKVGNIVPNIILPDSSGLLVELSKLDAEKTLIIFYASWCPHCQTLLPQVFELYKSQKEKKFEVIAVSIDTSRTDWLNFVKANNLNCLNVSDIKGWNGQAVLDYYIYATPTMFLVDKNKRLIGLPKKLDEIKSFGK
jgi:peroxiredoxin